jgi:ATP-dependent Lhr-like helicase
MGIGSGAAKTNRGLSPVRATPLAFVARRNMPVWEKLISHPPGEEARENLSTHARAVYDHLVNAGASFFDDLVAGTRLLPTQIEPALGELVSWGLVTSDGFQGLRTLITPSAKRAPIDTTRGRRRIGTVAALGMTQAGRWSLLSPKVPPPPAEDGAGAGLHSRAEVEALARSLLARYGVVFRKLLERERSLPPWRDLQYCYRRMEARGELRGGRFVAGFSGEQFALPEAVGALRDMRRKKPNGQWVSLSGADPLNLLGILTPGPRLASLAANRVLFRDGEPVAIREGGNVQYLVEMDSAAQWDAQHALLRRVPPAYMRVYQGQPG